MSGETLATQTYDDFMDSLSEESSPEVADKIITKKTGVTAKKQNKGSGSSGAIPKSFFIDGALNVQAGIFKVQSDIAMLLTEVVLGAGVPSVGAVIEVDLKYHATDPDSAVTIFSSKPQIAAASHTGSSSSLSITSIAKNGWLVIDITIVGSTTPGEKLTISMRQD